jgi:pilus assembly protein CpaE
MTELLPLVGVADLPTFLGFATDDHSRQTLQMAAAARGWVGAEVRAGGVDAAQEHVAASGSPAFLVIDISDSAAPLHSVDALANICAAGTRVIAIGTRNDVALFRGLRALGVADYLVKPLDAAELGDAIGNALGESGGLVAGHHAETAETIAVMGARGGAGTTSIALSLAQILGAGGRRVIFFDLDLQAGSATLDIDSEPSPGLAALMESPDRVDQALVEAALRPHRLGFSLLSAAEPLDRPVRATPDAVQAVLAALAKVGDTIVIDMPRRLDRAGRTLLRTADRVIIVTPMTLAGLRESQRLGTFITGVRAGQRPLFVANRTGETGAEVSMADFEHVVGVRPAVALPYQPRLARRAAERAATLSVAAERTPFAGLLAGLAAMAAAPAPMAPPSGWKGRLQAWLRQPGRS